MNNEASLKSVSSVSTDALSMPFNFKIDMVEYVQVLKPMTDARRRGWELELEFYTVMSVRVWHIGCDTTRPFGGNEVNFAPPEFYVVDLQISMNILQRN